MTIRLTQAVLIAGADTPIGTKLSLNAALEADLVNGNKAVYVSGAPVGGAVAVTSQIDVATGKTDLVLSPDYTHSIQPAASGGFAMLDWDTVTIGAVTSGWTVEKENSVKFGGKTTLKVTGANGAATTMTCELTFPSSLFFGGAKRKGFHALFSDAALEGYGNTACQLWLHYAVGTYNNHRMACWAYPNHGVGDWAQGYVFDQDGTSLQHFSLAPDWNIVNCADGLTPFGLSTKVQLVMTKAATGTVIGPVYISPIIGDPLYDATPILTIFHDGQYRGQYDYARKILKARGLRASLSMLPYWFNDYPSTGGGRFPNTMSEAQLLEMYAMGHELIHHTGTFGPSGHVNVGWNDTSKYPDGSEYELVKADIEASQSWMRANNATRGLGYGVVGFTNGLDKAQTLARRTNITNALKDAGMLKMRQLGAYYESYYGNCGEQTLIPPQSVMTLDATSAATITGYVDMLIARGGWTGLTFHNIYVGSTTGANDMDHLKYITIMDYIKTKVDAGVLRVLPFSEAMREMDKVPGIAQ